MKVAIVGGSPSTENDAPFDDQSWEIWCHGNQMQRHLQHRVTRIFEIHDDLSEHPEGYAQWLVDLGIPLTVGEAFPIDAPHVERFVFDPRLVVGQDHLSSTPAYMMARALANGATHIGIYGVDMSVDDHEYFMQRPSMYAWIAYAKAKGVEIFIPEKSPLFKGTHIEGRGSGGKPNLARVPFSQEQFLQMAHLHEKRVNTLNAQIREIESQIHAHNGSRQAYERLAKVARAVESGQEIKTLTESLILR